MENAMGHVAGSAAADLLDASISDEKPRT